MAIYGKRPRSFQLGSSPGAAQRWSQNGEESVARIIQYMFHNLKKEKKYQPEIQQVSGTGAFKILAVFNQAF